MRGFIYALINPTISGLIKVGHTDRDPETRAKELSDRSGVPTPFIVAYKRFVSDSVQGEAWVHTFLETRGYRLSERRESFSAPLWEVVEAIRSYPDVPHSPLPIENEVGAAVSPSTDEAIAHFKEAVTHGDDYSYADMAELFVKLGHSEGDVEISFGPRHPIIELLLKTGGESCL